MGTQNGNYVTCTKGELWAVPTRLYSSNELFGWPIQLLCNADDRRYIFPILEVSMCLLNMGFHIHKYFFSPCTLIVSHQPELNPTRMGRISAQHVKPVLRNNVTLALSFSCFFFTPQKETHLRVQSLHSDVYIDLRDIPLLKALYDRHRRFCAWLVTDRKQTAG